MEKLDLQTPNFTDENIQKLSELFPNCVTEDADGKAIDFDQLRQELSNNIIEGNQERYQLTWPGKAKSIVTANTPINKTLRPNREESKDFDNTENLYIEGDNLEVLKLLQETYLNKIKMIYIDPPYNTGQDFVYKDKFTQDKAEYDEESGNVDDEGGRLVSNPDSNGRYHSDWLSMMYPRLKLARNLLEDEGIIFISIDDNELDNLKKICDEIFGKGNFIDNIIWKKRYGGGAKEKYLVTVHEYTLIYARNIQTLPEIFIPLGNESIKRYYKSKDSNFAVRGPYRTHPLEAGIAVDSRPNLIFDIMTPDGGVISPKRQWYWSKDRVENAISKGELEFVKGKSGEWTVHSKQYLKDEDGVKRQAKAFSLIDDIYSQHGTNEVLSIFGNAKIFSYPKPSQLLLKFLEIGLKSQSNGVVMDFFSGSSSMAHAVMQLNVKDGGSRKFIMVQIPEVTDKKSEAYKAGYKNIAEIGKERIRRAGEKIKEDNADKESIEDLDTGFRVLKIDSSNMKDVNYNPDNTQQSNLLDLASNIKDSRTEEDLLFQVLLDWGVDLTLKIERKDITGKSVYFVDDDTLVACFEDDIDENFVKELAKTQPLRVVFRDSGFASDGAKINVEQIFKHTSEHTDIKVI